jgi:hypothetical protein
MNSFRFTRSTSQQLEHCKLPAQTQPLSGTNQVPKMAAVDENGDEIRNFDEETEQREQREEASLQQMTADFAELNKKMLEQEALVQQQQAHILQQDKILHQQMLQQQATQLLAQQQAQNQLAQEHNVTVHQAAEPQIQEPLLPILPVPSYASVQQTQGGISEVVCQLAGLIKDTREQFTKSSPNSSHSEAKAMPRPKS